MSDPTRPSEWSDPAWQTPQPAQPQQPSQPPSPYGPPASGPPASDQPASGTPAYGPPAYVQPYTQPMYGHPVYVSQPTNSMAVASLVCSLVGVMLIVPAPVGAVLGHVARRQIQQSGEQGDGLALAGIIVGWIVTGLVACVCVGYFGLFALIFGVGSIGAVNG